jgi:hypothetical protein
MRTVEVSETDVEVQPEFNGDIHFLNMLIQDKVVTVEDAVPSQESAMRKKVKFIYHRVHPTKKFQVGNGSLEVQHGVLGART